MIMKFFRNHKDQKWHIPDEKDSPSLCGCVNFISWMSEFWETNDGNKWNYRNYMNLCKTCCRIHAKDKK